jgi:hypothetical protein
MLAVALALVLTGTLVPAVLRAGAVTSSQVLQACETDGSLIETALAAYVAHNPGAPVSEAALLEKSHGGPYISRWSTNVDFYQFSVSSKKLHVQSAKFGSVRVLYTSPASCVAAGVSRPTNWATPADLAALNHCQADGAILGTAMQAFRDVNPRITISEAYLLSKKYQGPYLRSWPTDPHYFQFSIRGGVLFLQSALGGIPMRYTSPNSCVGIGLP